MSSRARYVTDISEYKKENISPLFPNQREIQGIGKQKYTEFPFRFRHEIGEGNKIESLFLIQGTKVTLDNGIQPPNPKFISDDRAIPPACTVKIDMIGEEGRALERMILDLRDVSAEAAFKNKMTLGSFGKRIDNVEIAKSLIAPPIYYRYGADGNPDPAKPPSKYLQLVEYDRKIKTSFKVPTGRGDETRLIEPEILFHKTIICVPTYWAKRFFVGANASIQLYLESAIVVDIVEQVNAPVQSRAIRSIVEANPEAVERMNRMLGITSVSGGSVSEDFFFSGGGGGGKASVAGDSPSSRNNNRVVNEASLPEWIKAGSSSSTHHNQPSTSKKNPVLPGKIFADDGGVEVDDDDSTHLHDKEEAGDVASQSEGDDDDTFKSLDHALTSTSSSLAAKTVAVDSLSSSNVTVPPAAAVRRVFRKTATVNP